MNELPVLDEPTPVGHPQPGILSGQGGSLLASVACAFRAQEEQTCCISQ